MPPNAIVEVEAHSAVPIRLVRLTLVLLIFGLVVGIGQFLQTRVYYQLVAIEAPDSISLTFLQRASSDGEACTAAASTTASLIRANCPTCKVTKQQCLSDLSLSSDLRKLLSELPIAKASARIVNGAIAFAHPDAQTALAACMESQKQAAAASAQTVLTCHPADTPRPLAKLHNKTIAATQATFHYLAQAIAVLGAGFAIFLAVQFFSVRSPIDAIADPSPEETTVFKMSNLAKRGIDILLSIILLSLLFPILLLVAVLIFVLEGYPVFYVSRRFISLNHCVTVLKFRTMVKDANSPKYRLRERFMRDGYLDIPLNCEVYTPIGRFLERTQLVEILQLFNILFHGMSLIGNRPLPRENIELLRHFNGWEGRFDSPAGLTGLSQIVGKLSQSPEERIELECLYSSVYKNKAGNILLCDLIIAYYTVRLLVFGKYLSLQDARSLVMAASGK